VGIFRGQEADSDLDALHKLHKVKVSTAAAAVAAAAAAASSAAENPKPKTKNETESVANRAQFGWVGIGLGSGLRSPDCGLRAPFICGANGQCQTGVQTPSTSLPLHGT